MSKIETAINMAKKLKALMEHIVMEDTLGNDAAGFVDACASDMAITIEHLESYQYAVQLREEV